MFIVPINGRCREQEGIIIQEFFVSIFVGLGYIFIIGLFFLVPTFFLNKKVKSKILDKVVLIFSYIIGITLVVFALSFYVYLLIYTFIIVYNLIYLVSSKFFSTSVSSYLALTVTLMIGAYFPEKIGYLFMLIMNKITQKNDGFSNAYIPFVKFLRIRMWIYFFAFFITIISSIEIIGGKTLILYPIWANVKPYISPSVVTFIAFDRFIKMFSDEKNAIIGEISNLVKTIRGNKEEETVD